MDLTYDLKSHTSLKNFVVCDALSLREAVPLISSSGFVFLRASGNVNIFIPNDFDVITRYPHQEGGEYILLKKVNFVLYTQFLKFWGIKNQD